MASLVLAFAGQAIGGAIGGTVLGVSAATIGGFIGSAVGGMVDGMLTGPQKVVGPRLTDINIQGSTEGAPIPRIDGAMRLAGQIIWATKFKETKHTESGGKGIPSVKTTTFNYSISFAVGLCEGVVHKLGRIWADGNLLDTSKYTIRFYQGTEDQDPDPLMEEIEGAGNNSAYRGTCYVVFEDMKLAAFGNRIPQLQFEIIRSVTASNSDALENVLTSVNLIPGAGEFVYATETITTDNDKGKTSAQNVNNASGTADVLASLDDLTALAANLTSVTIVAGWFGDDLRCGEILIKPGVETDDKKTYKTSWKVNGITRGSAYVVSQIDGRPAYGGTPSDDSIVQLIAEIKSRGLAVNFYPFLFMDIAEGNTLPNPYSDSESESGQAVYPWRGRITCSPAAGYVDSVDQTGDAATQVASFFGSASASDFAVSGTEVSWTGGSDWGWRRCVLHYAKLCVAAGGVDAFLIGSELIGLTHVRSDATTYPAVDALVTLAADVKAIVGSGCAVSYAADWSEYANHQTGDAPGAVLFNLDPLWASSDIDFIGIDNYMPLADWRDGTAHLDYDAENGPVSDADRDYLQGNIRGGEDYDWYYQSQSDRDAQTRTTISDATYGKPWVFRAKDLWGWWSNAHYDRPDGTEDGTPTDWTASSKPIRFIELGCPAIDKGANQPNVFYDPKSSESAVPYYSTGERNDLIQRAFLEAHLNYWPDDGADLVTNGTFDSDISGWTTSTAGGGGSIVWDSGTIRFTQGGSSVHMYASQAIPTVPGDFYVFEATALTASSGNYMNTRVGTTLAAANIAASANQGAGTIVLGFQAIGTTTYITIRDSQGVAQTSTWDNITCRRVNNPWSNVYAGRMVDADNISVWCWDARPFPYFPQRSDIWGDTANYQLGHWLNGRLGAVMLADLVAEICDGAGFADYDVSDLAGLVTGYARTSTMSPRDEITPLASAFFFDSAESEGQIKFRMRGRASVLSLTEDDLVFEPDGETRAGFSFTDADPFDLPIVSRISFIDAGNSYQQGVYEAKRLVGNSNRRLESSVPLVLDRSLASGIGDRLLHEAWIARRTGTAALPPSRLALDPGDDITITAGGRNRRLRLTAIADTQARAIGVVGSDPSIYESIAGPARETNGSILPSSPGRAILVFADLPMLTDLDVAWAPHLAAYADPWPVELYVYRSATDSGYELNSTIARPSAIGETTADFYSGPLWRWDSVNTLSLTLYSGTLASADEQTVLGGANALAVQNGAGEWEIVQFKTATLTAPSTWTLSGLLRGQLGTEGAMADPVPSGARVVVLDTSVTQLDIALSEFNLAFSYKWGPSGTDISDSAYQSDTLTFEGAGLRPYAPCHLSWFRVNAGIDIQFSWVRRDRSPSADSWDGVDAPMSEETESYELEIIDPSDSSIVRLVTGLPVPSFLYLGADQITDFGAGLAQGDSVIIAVYQISAAYGRGEPATREFFL